MNPEQARIAEEYRQKDLLKAGKSLESWGLPCHYMRERDSHRVCFYTECGCPFDDGNPIIECSMYKAIIENHRSLGIEDDSEVGK